MQKSMRNNIRILVWFIAVAAVIVIAVILITNFSKEAHAAADDSDGIQIIQSMEDAPVAPIEEHIFQMEKEEIQRKLLEDPSRTFETLTDIDTIIVGDSRVVGFAMYGFMDPSRILAGTSWSIQEIPALYGTIEQMHPRFIVVAFGINEIGQQLYTPVYYSTHESYAQDLVYYLDQIQSVAPDAKIYFSSILPCNELGLSLQPGFGIIPERNKVIRKYVEDAGYGYIDTEPVGYAHPDLYISDGVHFFAEFYPFWGRAILEQIIKDGGIS